MMDPALKHDVKNYWEDEVCGTRYAGPEAQRFAEIERTRYEFIPYLRDYVQFEQGKGKDVLEIGVGAGTDFSQWAAAGAECTGINLTEGLILPRQ